MSRRGKSLFPFPFKNLGGTRVNVPEQITGIASWQAQFKKAEEIYYSRQRRRKKSYLAFEELAYKALSIARDEQNLVAIAKTLSLISRFQFEIGHDDCIQTLRQSIVAAQAAYGEESKEVAIQMSGLCLKLEELGMTQEADEVAWQAFQMMEKNTTCSEQISLNDAVIEVALASKDSETAREAAFKGIRLTKLHVGPDTVEYEKRLQYYESLIEP
ncbi:MAG TPA: hypothetical protein PKZ32_01645 [Candidatus Melainabacteria bacterium]|nr:hypothetical protein [Candidatus Melainabacteria bacterium]